MVAIWPAMRKKMRICTICSSCENCDFRTWHDLARYYQTFFDRVICFQIFLDGWSPHNELDNLRPNKTGVNPLFSCENERFVSFSAKRGRKKVVTKIKKSRDSEFSCPSGAGSGAIFTWERHPQDPSRIWRTSRKKIEVSGEPPLFHWTSIVAALLRGPIPTRTCT